MKRNNLFFVIITILVVATFLYVKKLYLLSKNDAQIVESKSGANTVHAEIFLPYINGKLSDKFIAYVNFNDSYSFLVPGDWKTDLEDTHESIRSLACYACGNGNKNINLKTILNVNNLSLVDLVKNTFNILDIEQLEEYNSRVLIDRYPPGAGPGQEAFIASEDNSKVIKLYCSLCTDQEMDNIIDSFVFDTYKYINQ